MTPGRSRRRAAGRPDRVQKDHAERTPERCRDRAATRKVLHPEATPVADESCFTCNHIQTTFAAEIDRGTSYRCSRCGRLIGGPPAGPPADQFWLLTGEVPAGPFTVAQIHAELATGRANWQTPACPVGGSTWLPLVRTPGIGPDAAERDGAAAREPRGEPTPPAPPVPKPPPLPPAPTEGGGRPKVGVAWKWLTGRFDSRPTTTWLVVVVVVVAGIGLWVWSGVRDDGDDRREQVRVKTPVAPPPLPIDTRMEVLTLAPGQEVHYRAGCRTEAERLGRALAEAGFVEKTWPRPVKVDRTGDTWRIEWSLKTAAFDDPKTVPATERWVAIPVAASVIPAGRVEILLRDTNGKERTVYTITGAHRSPIDEKSAVYTRGRKKEDGDRLASLCRGLLLDGTVRWVILLERRADEWIVTPLNVVPNELTPGVRRRWANLARAASQEFDAPVRVEILDENYQPVVRISATDPDP